MLDFIDTLISYVAPHECLACGTEGQVLCSYCRQFLPDMPPGCYKCGAESASYAVCETCNEASGLQNVWVRTPYEGFAQELVQRLKFERAYSVSTTIAVSLLDSFAYLLPVGAVIVPIPTASSRVRARGYDQSVLIAKAFAKRVKLPYSTALSRIGQHRQTGNKRTHRLMQLEQVFEVKNHTLKNKPIILIDDVLTTGATIESAASALRKAGFEHISAMTFARA